MWSGVRDRRGEVVGDCVVSASTGRGMKRRFGMGRFTYGSNSRIMFVSSRLMSVLSVLEGRIKGPMRVGDNCEAPAEGGSMKNTGCDCRVENVTTSVEVGNVDTGRVTGGLGTVISPSRYNVVICGD